MPKNSAGLYKIYNSGLVLYSKEGMIKGKNHFTPIQKFIDDFRPHFKPKLFWRDQAYIHVMFAASGLDSCELDPGWNSQIHWLPNTKPKSDGFRPIVDCRTKNTKFVHIQLSGSGKWDQDKLWQVVNLPIREWDFRI